MVKGVKRKYFVGDFETTYVEETDETFVWLSALANMRAKTDSVVILRTVEETLDFLMKQGSSLVFYHNLKFDGSFILSYLLNHPDFTEHHIEDAGEELPLNTFDYMISGMGAWYEIEVNYYGVSLTFYDSYKILPFSVETIGNSFKTKQKKLTGTVDYSLYRDQNWEPTQTELAYIKHDVLVVKEALWNVIKGSEPRMTIGSYCLSEYKKMINGECNRDIAPFTEYDEVFPDLSEFPIDFDQYGAFTADEYIRKSYHGGFCYLMEGKENKLFHNGIVVDVNSLYPSVMSGESGNRYPVGTPVFYKGEEGQTEVRYSDSIDLYGEGCYYFVRFRCRFELKPGMLPTVQIKGNHLYRSNKWLTTSDFEIDGKRYYKFKDISGLTHVAEPIMTMTCTDYELFLEHYDVFNLQIIDYCVFPCKHGLFDSYINKYREIKENSTGAQRTLAKLYLNNLYGKLASNPVNYVKHALLDEDGKLYYETVREADKKAGHIATGSAITAYARLFTITAAQKNYEHFIYADTDSLHCDMQAEDLVDVPLDDKAFLHWKHESSFDDGIYVRQKTYLEREGDRYEIKCAGMGSGAKENFIRNIQEGTLTMEDFKVGLQVSGKKVSHRAKGGVAIVEAPFVLR